MSIRALLTGVLFVGSVSVSYWLGTKHEEFFPPPPKPPEALIQVTLGDPAPDLLNTNPGERPSEPDRLRIEANLHATILTNSSFLMDVLQNPNLKLRQTEWFKSFDTPQKARKWLTKHLHADAIKDSRLVKVYFDTPPVPPEAAVTVLREIIEEHLEGQRRLVSNRMRDRSAQLTSRKNSYEVRVIDARQRLDAVLVRMADEGVNPEVSASEAESELRALVEQRSQLVARSVAQPSSMHPPPDHGIEAIDQRLAVLRKRLANLTMLRDEHRTIRADLDAAAASVREIKTALDDLAAANRTANVSWAQYPSIPQFGEE